MSDAVYLEELRDYWIKMSQLDERSAKLARNLNRVGALMVVNSVFVMFTGYPSLGVAEAGLGVALAVGFGKSSDNSMNNSVQGALHAILYQADIDALE